MTLTAKLYRTDFPNHCRTHAIDGLLLVFHRPSGATHFLDSPVPEMLTLLAEASLSAHDLTARLCEQLGTAHDEEAAAVVETRLTELIAAGLIQTG